MQHKTHSEHSSCCNHEHDHGGEFILKNEIFSLALIGILYITGLVFEQQLHNTPYAIA